MRLNYEEKRHMFFNLFMIDLLMNDETLLKIFILKPSQSFLHVQFLLEEPTNI